MFLYKRIYNYLDCRICYILYSNILTYFYFKRMNRTFLWNLTSIENKRVPEKSAAVDSFLRCRRGKADESISNRGK